MWALRVIRPWGLAGLASWENGAFENVRVFCVISMPSIQEQPGRWAKPAEPSGLLLPCIFGRGQGADSYNGKTPGKGRRGSFRTLL